MLSLRAGYFFNDIYNDGMYRGDRYQYATSAVGFPGVPPEYQQPRLYANVPNNYGVDREKGPHLGIQLDGTVYFDAAGRHQVKGGAQFDRIGLDMLEGYTGNLDPVLLGPGLLRPAGYLRLLPAREQRRSPQPRAHHAGRGERQQPGVLPPGRLDDRRTAHAPPGPSHRERARAVPARRPSRPGERHAVRVRRQAGAPAGLRLGRHRRREDEGLRLLGRLLRHHEARR